MPFKKVNVTQMVEERKKDEKFLNAYNALEDEYALIEKAINLRKKAGVSQVEVAIGSGLSQQAVSRIEKLGNSPTLLNFIRYISAAGLELRIEKKSNDSEIKIANV